MNSAVEESKREYEMGKMKSIHMVDRKSSIPRGPQDSNTTLKLKLVKASSRYTTPILSLESFWSISSKMHARSIVPANDAIRVILLDRII